MLKPFGILCFIIGIALIIVGLLCPVADKTALLVIGIAHTVAGSLSLSLGYTMVD